MAAPNLSLPPISNEATAIPVPPKELVPTVPAVADVIPPLPGLDALNTELTCAQNAAKKKLDEAVKRMKDDLKSMTAGSGDGLFAEVAGLKNKLDTAADNINSELESAVGEVQAFAKTLVTDLIDLVGKLKSGAEDAAAAALADIKKNFPSFDTGGFFSSLSSNTAGFSFCSIENQAVTADGQVVKPGKDLAPGTDDAAHPTVPKAAPAAPAAPVPAPAPAVSTTEIDDVAELYGTVG